MVDSSDIDKPLPATQEEFVKPEGTLEVAAIRGLQNVTLDSVKSAGLLQMGSATSEARQKFVDGVTQPLANIFAGNRPAGWEPLADAFHDSQLEITDRVDLLDGLRGYCSAYQTLNINSKYSYGDDRVRLLPFDGQVGPAKGAHIDSEKKGIVIDEPGAWLVFCMAKTDRTGYASGGSNTDGSSITMRVYAPDGSEYSKTTAAAASEGNEDSLVIVKTLVVPASGYWVEVRSWSSRWRWWLGGTEFSALTVYKLDSRVENAGRPTVPDEGSPEGTEPEPAPESSGGAE